MPTVSTLVPNDWLAAKQLPQRGPVMMSVVVLRREGRQAVVRVKGGIENGYIDIFDVDQLALVDCEGEVLIPAELIDCHRHPGRYLAMHLSGTIRVQGQNTELSVPFMSLEAISAEHNQNRSQVSVPRVIRAA